MNCQICNDEEATRERLRVHSHTGDTAVSELDVCEACVNDLLAEPWIERSGDGSAD